MADHDLGPNKNGYNEIWLRYYVHPSAGFDYGSQKAITLNSNAAGYGGITIGGIGIPEGDGNMLACPVYDCNTTGAVYYYRPNMAPALKLQDIGGHWAFVEIHAKLNTPGQKNGVYELWMNDCGTNGLGCTGTPTLRSKFTTVEWQAPTDNKQIKSIWFENWANPGSSGTELYDQIKVAKVGPIGFMGASAPPPQPVCGDGIKNGTEACDGASGCPAPGVCTSTCTQCTQPTLPPPPACGDGLLNGTEVCDGILGCTAPSTCNATCTVCSAPPPAPQKFCRANPSILSCELVNGDMKCTETWTQIPCQ